MLFVFFGTLTLLGFLLFFGGWYTQQWSLVLLGSVVILTCGMISGAEGIQAPPIVDTISYDGSGNPTTITETYTTYNQSNSFEVSVITNLFIYGGILFIVLSLVALFASAGVDDVNVEAYDW